MRIVTSFKIWRLKALSLLIALGVTACADGAGTGPVLTDVPVDVPVVTVDISPSTASFDLPPEGCSEETYEEENFENCESWIAEQYGPELEAAEEALELDAIEVGSCTSCVDIHGFWMAYRANLEAITEDLIENCGSINPMKYLTCLAKIRQSPQARADLQYAFEAYCACRSIFTCTPLCAGSLEVAIIASPASPNPKSVFGISSPLRRTCTSAVHRVALFERSITGVFRTG